MGAHADRLRRKVLREPPQIKSEAMLYSAIEQILQHTTLSGFQVVGILEHFAARTNLQIVSMQQGEDDRVAQAEGEAAEQARKDKEEANRKAREEYAARHV